MIGAVIGDVVGSKYEFDNIKTKDFEFLASDCYFTDDTVLTMAVCEVLLEVSKDMTDDEIRSMMTRSIRKWGRKYPDESYGIRFGRWLMADDEKPYGSFGNGSAMRVSSAGWLFDDMETTRRMARLSAEVPITIHLGSREQKQLQQLYSWQETVLQKRIYGFTWRMNSIMMFTSAATRYVEHIPLMKPAREQFQRLLQRSLMVLTLKTA